MDFLENLKTIRNGSTAPHNTAPHSDETPWLTEIRQQGIQNAESIGFPKRKWEDWRYTPLTGLKDFSFSWPRPIVGMNDILNWPEVKPWISEETTRLVYLNGHFCQSLSNYSQDTGITV